MIVDELLLFFVSHIIQRVVLACAGIIGEQYLKATNFKYFGVFLLWIYQGVVMYTMYMYTSGLHTDFHLTYRLYIRIFTQNCHNYKTKDTLCTCTYVY